MSLPPEMPVQRRATLVLVLFVMLIFLGAIAGIAPLLRKWFGEWSQGG